MARRNRVTPLGELVADACARARLRQPWLPARRRRPDPPAVDGKRWIACRLVPGWRRAPLLQPGRFTELFFLDRRPRSRRVTGPAPSAGARTTSGSRRPGGSSIPAGPARTRRRAAPRGAFVAATRGQRRHDAPSTIFRRGVRRASTSRLVPGGDCSRWSAAGYTAGAPRPERRARDLDHAAVARRGATAAAGGRRVPGSCTPRPTLRSARDELDAPRLEAPIFELYAEVRAAAIRSGLGALARGARALFRTHPQSPLPGSGRASGLRYFDYDPALRVLARSRRRSASAARSRRRAASRSRSRASRAPVRARTARSSRSTCYGSTATAAASSLVRGRDERGETYGAGRYSSTP